MSEETLLKEFVDSYKGEDEIKFDIGEEFELNLIAGISELLKMQREECSRAWLRCHDGNVQEAILNASIK